jgi:hypothetical protein
MSVRTHPAMVAAGLDPAVPAAPQQALPAGVDARTTSGHDAEL